VLGYTYVNALGRTHVASKIALGEKSLTALTPRAGGNAIRHTAIDVAAAEVEPERYSACFKDLIGQMSEVLAELPMSVPFDVRINLPGRADQALMLEAWNTRWREAGLRPLPASLLSTEKGLMELDDWLDVEGGPALEKFTLYVSVQLHSVPPENSAEAAVALLLGWAPLAERRDVKPVAMLHRPVEVSEMSLNLAIGKVILWGNATASQIKDLWQAGLLREDKPALINGADDLTLSLSKVRDFDGIHDIDVALGHPGVAAGWLAAALAIEYATQTNEPQLIASREGTLRLAIAQPTTPVNEAEPKA
jgi:hypothetical protein